MMNRLTPAGPGPSASANNLNVSSEMGRKKVALAPGHSLMDWIRLGRTKGDLSGVGSSKRGVTPQDLALHNQVNDIWMAIRGKVYNITPYMDYHPGGTDELMRAAGKDGTDLFDEIHNWVNIESMLEKCFIGPLKSQTGGRRASGGNLQKKSTTTSLAPPTSNIGVSSPEKPTIDFYQSANTVTVVIYTKQVPLSHENVIVDIRQSELLIEVTLSLHSFFVHVNPNHQLAGGCKVNVVKGKVEIVLDKKKTGVNWSSLGKPLKHHQQMHLTKSVETRFSAWTCLSNTEVTHDTRLLVFQAPKDQLYMQTPVGRHIVARHSVSGMEISRSYTVARPSLKPCPDLGSNKETIIYLMIKSYVGGALSPWITNIKPGSTADISGHYYGSFSVSCLAKINHLVMFAAGTGFTSMISVIHHALYEMSESSFPVTLVFFNKTVRDILWKKELDALAQAQTRFTVQHILSQEGESWKGLRGRVCQSHVDQFVPTPSDTERPMLLVCGPKPFHDLAESLAKNRGLDTDQIFVFSHH